VVGVTANQLTEACGWEQIPRYLIRDREDIYPPGSVDRHSRPPDISSLTLAKCMCRTADRFDPNGMH
jgi:hypothetical protein